MVMATKKKASKFTTSAVRTKYSKTQIVAEICEATGLTRAQCNGVLDGLTAIIERHLKKGAVGQFVMPGLLKIICQQKPATKARRGINPFTGEEVMFKAKPARTVVKVRPLKKLKAMAG